MEVLEVAAAEAVLRRHVEEWGLRPVGAVWSTASSCLAHVRTDDGSLAVLKVPRVEEERAGSRVLRWWSGAGAARVLAADDDGTVLVEQALQPDASLAELARRSTVEDGSSDLRATATLVEVVQRLHRHPARDVPAGVVPLRRWFADLFVHADEVGGFFARAAATADALLDDPRDRRVLHGDVHHENVLWFGEQRGWLAIDPKGLEGESAFDYANILTNPDRSTMLRPRRFSEHVDLIAAATGTPRDRLLRWSAAWCGLSAAWHERAGSAGPAADVVRVGLLAEQALARPS